MPPNEEVLRGKSLTRGAAEVIVDFLKNNKGNYLEIGCYDGVNLTTVANLVKDRICYGIDPFLSDGHCSSKEKGSYMPKQRDNLLANIEGKENIFFFEMTTEEFSKTQKIEDYDISTVLVDGSHTYDSILLDIDVALTAIGNKKGMIIFDDLHVDAVDKATHSLANFLSSVNRNFASVFFYKDRSDWISSDPYGSAMAKFSLLRKEVRRILNFLFRPCHYVFFIIEENK